ncbi:hypothetical protein WDZ92_07185 [Nostoc sp. NIES-2111]
MPEQPPPKRNPSSDAEQRARELAAEVQPDPGHADPLEVATDALTNIAFIAAHGWRTDREKDEALKQINEIALGAWAQIRGR